MARVNVYLPDDLADEVRRAGLNVSNLAQRALRRELASLSTAAWLRRVSQMPTSGVDHGVALAALDEARDDLDDRWLGR